MRYLAPLRTLGTVLKFMIKPRGRPKRRRWHRSRYDCPRVPYTGPNWIGSPISARPTEQGPEWIGQRIPYRSEPSKIDEK